MRDTMGVVDSSADQGRKDHERGKDRNIRHPANSLDFDLSGLKETMGKRIFK